MKKTKEAVIVILYNTSYTEHSREFHYNDFIVVFYIFSLFIYYDPARAAISAHCQLIWPPRRLTYLLPQPKADNWHNAEPLEKIKLSINKTFHFLSWNPDSIFAIWQFFSICYQHCAQAGARMALQLLLLQRETIINNQNSSYSLFPKEKVNCYNNSRQGIQTITDASTENWFFLFVTGISVVFKLLSITLTYREGSAWLWE